MSFIYRQGYLSLFHSHRLILNYNASIDFMNLVNVIPVLLSREVKNQVGLDFLFRSCAQATFSLPHSFDWPPYGFRTQMQPSDLPQTPRRESRCSESNDIDIIQLSI